MHTSVHDEHFYGMIAVSVEVCTRKYFHTRYVHMASVRTSVAAVAVSGVGGAQRDFAQVSGLRHAMAAAAS